MPIAFSHANANPKLNPICSICSNIGSSICVVKGAVIQFYKGLYHEYHPLRPIFDGISHNSMSTDDALDLVMDFSNEEVWNTVNDLGKEKSLSWIVLCFFLA